MLLLSWMNGIRMFASCSGSKITLTLWGREAAKRKRLVSGANRCHFARTVRRGVHSYLSKQPTALTGITVALNFAAVLTKSVLFGQNKG